MIILSSSDIQPTNFQTPWGNEQGISYLGKTFLPVDTHETPEQAIDACRRDLDSGTISIIVDEGSETHNFFLRRFRHRIVGRPNVDRYNVLSIEFHGPNLTFEFIRVIAH